MQEPTDERKNLLRREQLDVIIGYACNAKCPHCIQDIRFRSSVFSAETFFERFEIACDYYFNEIGGNKVIITGGEPSIFPLKMLGLLKVLKNFPAPEFVATYTNGSGLLKNVPGKTESLLVLAAKAGLTDVNLSVHHYEAKRNRSFQQLSTIPDAEVIAAEVHRNKLQLRLNCSMVAENICNLQEVIHYLEWSLLLAPKDVYFRDLHRIYDRTNAIRFAKKPQNVAYVDRQRIDFDLLLNEVRRSPLFTYLGEWNDKHTGQGEQYDFEYKGINVHFGFTDIGNENREQPTYFVFAPDGRLYTDWNGPKSLHHIPLNFATKYLTKVANI